MKCSPAATNAARWAARSLAKARAARAAELNATYSGREADKAAAALDTIAITKAFAEMAADLVNGHRNQCGDET